MDDILRAQDLIRELEKLPPHTPIMVAVVKYPGQFEARPDWASSTSVEMVPIEGGEVYAYEGIGVVCVELTDYSEAVAQASNGG